MKRVSFTLLFLWLGNSKAFSTVSQINAPLSSRRTGTIQTNWAFDSTPLETKTKTSTTSLSASPVAGAIAGALTGGFFAGGLHAIAGKSFVVPNTKRLPMVFGSRCVLRHHLLDYGQTAYT